VVLDVVVAGEHRGPLFIVPWENNLAVGRSAWNGSNSVTGDEWIMMRAMKKRHPGMPDLRYSLRSAQCPGDEAVGVWEIVSRSLTSNRFDITSSSSSSSSSSSRRRRRRHRRRRRRCYGTLWYGMVLWWVWYEAMV
jgi:hypothetical protein